MGIVTVVAVSVIVVIAALLPLGLFLRCRRVDAVRSQKLRESYAAAVGEMNTGEQSWEWHFDVHQEVPTFDEMVWKVWRPVSSFYDDRRPDAPR